jgi:hypothetical protein
VIPEAPLEDGGHGLVPRGEGWFVVNTREARWWYAPKRGAMCFYEGDVGFSQHPDVAYARIGEREPARYDGWLPG